MSQSLTDRIKEDMKTAMRARDSQRLGVIRLILAAIKQREVDERITLDDTQVVGVLGKMIKQRRESIAQFEQAGRQDLVDKETYEVTVIETYLPPALDDAELDTMVAEAIAGSGATSPKEMGKVMAALKDRIQGRADMGVVSAKVKARLSGA
jgi:uncharacterized protein YqeY